jgi:hypothetical protein
VQQAPIDCRHHRSAGADGGKDLFRTASCELIQGPAQRIVVEIIGDYAAADEQLAVRLLEGEEHLVQRPLPQEAADDQCRDQFAGGQLAALGIPRDHLIDQAGDPQLIAQASDQGSRIRTHWLHAGACSRPHRQVLVRPALTITSFSRLSLASPNPA